MIFLTAANPVPAMLNQNQTRPLEYKLGVTTRTIISVEPNDPRVKVFHDGSWGYICANNWDSLDAQVICRMQGYWHGKGTADLRALEQGQKVWLANMMCTGQEKDISQCRFQGWGQLSCPIGAVGAVSCAVNEQTKVQLVGGYGPWEGRLEVERNGVWRPVCKNGFGDFDAQVVCRMLGIRGTGGTAHTEQKFGQGTQPPLVHQLDCTGAESDLSQCKGSSSSEGEQCDSAGVECYSCGALLTTESGTVQSENYPLGYPGNLNCLYVIRPTNDQLLYKLEFNTTFSTEECCDTLEVKILSGPSNVPTGGTKYAGHQAPPRLLGKAFALNFVTDGSKAMEGFQAYWSPARVEDVVTIQCSSGHFTVDIDYNFLKRLYPNSSQQTIALADPSCTGRVTSVDNSDHIIITSETDACGTKIKGSTQIVRERRWEIPVHCSVPRADNFEVRYNPFPDVGKRDLRIDPEVVQSSAELENGHVRRGREVRGQISIDLDFPVTLTAYQNTNYSALAPTPLRRRLKEEVALRVQLEGGNSDLKLVLQNCYARPLPASSTTYYIIRDGCAVDVNTEILDTQLHNTDFRFMAFEFAGNFPEVYLECDVRVCPVGDSSAACTVQCGSAVGKRETSVGVVREKSAAEYKVSFGPVLIEK
ncbi:hypothetical protein BaRGS_00019832 [Batillaria attramentaria]|uniref:Scavenger receptor cysteine-rich domain-containing protein DMBT1 n=1 Tax=Batillaria attramentaria TaxID=370345 RepID=A0ABD0KQ97_9CAEN